MTTNYRIPSRKYAYMEDGDDARDLEYEDYMDGTEYDHLDDDGPIDPSDAMHYPILVV